MLRLPFLALVVCLLPPLAIAQERPVGCDSPEAHQFDFWAGEWDVQSRYRQASGEWYEVEETWSAEEAVGGCAFIDFADGNFSGTPMQGIGTRFYNPQTQTWTITWLSTAAPGQWGTWTGSFADDGTADFFQEIETPNGTVISRIAWSEITADSAHWEHAISRDAGDTWTTTWIMDFQRRTD